MSDADTKNRTRDLLITKLIYKLQLHINQSLTMLAKHKNCLTQPQTVTLTE